MNLSDEIDLEDYIARPDRISGADINSICQEAGMQAVRENRYIVLAKDFEKAYKNVVKKNESYNQHDIMTMFCFVILITYKIQNLVHFSSQHFYMLFQNLLPIQYNDFHVQLAYQLLDKLN